MSVVEMLYTFKRNMVSSRFPNLNMKYGISYTFILVILSSAIAEVERPRGVSLSKASLYQAGSDFTCFDGSGTIPFGYVNDDYCDCADGSDEPGTSACPNGFYHCTNAGHRPEYILSSRVNDGICDCCDGTDEYDSGAGCANTCRELGRKAREDEEKQRKLVEEGHAIYKEYVKQGEDSLKEKKVRKEQLEKEKIDVETQKAELEKIKNEAEEPEKEAKDRHQKLWEEEKERKKQELDAFKASDAFSELDVNQDNVVSIEEIQDHPEFDIDSNGEVSTEEAMEYLEEHDAIDFNTFVEKVWPNVREIYKAKKAPDSEDVAPPAAEEPPTPLEAPPTEAPSTDEPQPPATEGVDTYDDDNDNDEEYDDEDYDRDRYDENEEDYDDEDAPPPPETEYRREEDKNRMGDDDLGASTDEDMPPYDEATKALIDAAEKARSEFNQVDQKFRDIESELRTLDDQTGGDYGENNEFYPLRGQCFEYTESQYTYKLCPFDRTSQRGKHGGSETSLGKWGKWDGPQGKKYTVMKYERGQNCWNGPDRSVRVKVQCGTSNEVFGASEPNRCEYEFKFTTPAACTSLPEPVHNDPPRDEL